MLINTWWKMSFHLQASHTQRAPPPFIHTKIFTPPLRRVHTSWLKRTKALAKFKFNRLRYTHTWWRNKKNFYSFEARRGKFSFFFFHLTLRFLEISFTLSFVSCCGSPRSCCAISFHLHHCSFSSSFQDKKLNKLRSNSTFFFFIWNSSNFGTRDENSLINIWIEELWVFKEHLSK